MGPYLHERGKGTTESCRPKAQKKWGLQPLRETEAVALLRPRFLVHNAERNVVTENNNHVTEFSQTRALPEKEISSKSFVHSDQITKLRNYANYKME